MNNNVVPLEKGVWRVLDRQIDYERIIINYNWKKDKFTTYRYKLNKQFQIQRVCKYGRTLNGKCMQYKQGVKRTNRKLELTDDDMKGLFQQPCYYCGRKPHKQAWNGIDRVDNSKGYELDNCVSCCAMCNSMKETYTVKEFLSHIQKIYNYSLPKT